MNIEVRLRKGEFGNVKAIGSIVIDEAFVVTGIRVLECKTGKDHRYLCIGGLFFNVADYV